MKIIKPQQLVFLKNAYKLGKDSYLGVSAIAGCYLSNTNHFITEAQIWQSWKDSPMSVSFLDIPIVKQFAEFVLVGHADIGQELKTLDVEVRVGKIIRQWRIFGHGSYTRTNAFRSMSMDHKNTWGGEGNLYNPLGTGCKMSDTIPTVIERHGDRLYEKVPLTSPSPIPFEFKERKQYLDKVASIMSSKEYLDSSYPGYPNGFDLRYFQISAPSQWSRSSIWEDEVDFNLIGFGGSSNPISGKFADVNARMFIWKDKYSKVKEIPLLFQTIWLMPDYNIGLMVYTGVINLKDHILDESCDFLMLALDNIHQPKSLDYFLNIYKKRMESDTYLEFLLDYDLMPGAKSLNVITSKEHHPYSLKFDNKPMQKEEVDQYFYNINKAIKENVPNKEVKELLKNKAQSLNFKYILDKTENLTIEDKNFNSINESVSSFYKKDFQRCAFNKVNFKDKNFTNCIFTQCSFFECSFNNVIFEKTVLKNLEFYDCKFYNVKNIDCELSDSLFEFVIFEVVKIINTKWLKSNFCSTFFKSVDFEICKLDGNIFSEDSLIDINFKKGVVSSVNFNKTRLTNVKFFDLSFSNNSIIESNWNNCFFKKTHVNSFSTGSGIIFNKIIFEDCWLEKFGIGNATAVECEFNYCSIKEINLGKTNFSYSKFNSCDMMVSLFKDAILYKNEWKNTSAQQGVFYNAVLDGALFQHCNFVGSNFSMVFMDEDTSYVECLLDNIVWVPRRINS